MHLKLSSIYYCDGSVNLAKPDSYVACVLARLLKIVDTCCIAFVSIADIADVVVGYATGITILLLKKEIFHIISIINIPVPIVTSINQLRITNARPFKEVICSVYDEIVR